MSILKKKDGVFMDSGNKNRHNIIVLCCCIVCVIAVAVCIVVFLSAGKNDSEAAAKDKVVAGIADKKITESQFKFFARLILNQEEETVRELYSSVEKSDKDEIKKYTSNFANEYLVRVYEAEKAGITLTADEKASLEKQFEEDYTKNKKTDEGTLTKEDFYLYYYGISEKKYKEFWTNWYIIDKHTSFLESKADVSEENQQLAFIEYYDYLYSYTTSVIPLSVGADDTKEAVKEKAEGIAAQLRSGADFVALLKENCTDESLIAKNGVTDFYPAYKEVYSDIYDFVRTSEIGEISVIEAEGVFYVVRLDGIKDFEKLKGTEEMLKWTRTFYVNKTVSDLLSSEEYKYEIVQNVYDGIDLSELLAEAYKYWESVWEGNS